MTLTLVIGTGARLANGAPGELVLHRRGAVVGRASTCDWPLPDPTRHVSSRHFEIRYDGRGYAILDCSTNGTVLAATGERLSGQHSVAHGDRFQVGPFTIEARLSGDARAAAEPAAVEPAPAWRGWEPEPSAMSGSPSVGEAGSPESGSSNWDPAPAMNGGWDPALAPNDPDDWGSIPAVRPATGDAGWQPRKASPLAPLESHRVAGGWDSTPASPTAPGPRHGGWAPDAAASPPPPPVTSAWDAASPTPDPASAWSSAAPDRPPASSPDELWGRIAEGNVVDWARGGFGQPAEAERDPLGLSPVPARRALPSEPPRAPPAAPTASTAHARPDTPDPFLSGAGIDPASAGISNAAGLAGQAGLLFRRLVAGLMVMVEARARAKAQLGAEATAYSREGHNPLKFARTPEEAVAALLGPPRPGFMPPEVAVEDAYRELQQHQVATLKAMQGALGATLERFSPAAIRARADARGLLERVVPTARDAALWQAYEREFGGVTLGSDEAFLDMFAKEFRRAYNNEAGPRE